ncbi:unnamed protein product [Arctia plantaginis]|uniref:Uncharacterized protein n=1 Tax=Arctia plantaginis TaxID=874455 RepID=A0A8S0YXX0_ARCPL|nr:unnamed protein product [Arctia plantaginis]CAB3257583.1 unnamed protein product [Arctia plantaginis]
MNFRGILSKSSLRSASSGKSLTHSEEVSKLQSEIELLKQNIDSLKVSVESRDAAIGTLAREKEKIYIELKSAQRTNRNLHQQLVDERDIHSKEKEFLINEIKRLSKQNENEMKCQQNEDGHCDHDKQLLDDLKSKDEVIYNIGIKYMKIKSSKTLLQKKLEKLQVQNKKTCEKIIFLLQDNRKTLDILLDNLLKSSTVSPNSKKYLNLLQINANLHYENTQLKIYQSVKDSPEIPQQDHGHDQCDKSSSVELPVNTSAKLGIKSDGKVKTVIGMVLEGRRRPIHSKLKSLPNHDGPKNKNFKHIHRTLSPNIRGTFYRSASDSCIVRRNLSEFGILVT